MSKSRQETGTVLDEEFIGAVGEELVASRCDAQRVDRLRARIFDELSGTSAGAMLFDTVRFAEGRWIEVLPGIEKKTLQVHRERGLESYLLRIGAGATLPRHRHTADELCYIVDGDVALGDLRLGAGDFHFARTGSEHGEIRSENGALLFLQSAIDSRHHGA